MSGPKTVAVNYRGLPYELDMVACRRALVDCQVKGELDSMESLANKVEISRSTASRFFSGRPTSLSVTLDILEALHLRFEAVAHPLSLDETERPVGGEAGAGNGRRLRPGDGLGSGVRESVEVRT